jgi:hypothetical protein
VTVPLQFLVTDILNAMKSLLVTAKCNSEPLLRYISIFLGILIKYEEISAAFVFREVLKTKFRDYSTCGPNFYTLMVK